MTKKNYLSPSEQEIWGPLQKKQIIDIELVHMVFPDYSKSFIAKILHGLYKKGYLKKARRDVFYNPLELDHYWLLALYIHPGYLGLTSALRYHNLTEYEDFHIFVITEDYRNHIDLEQYDITYLPLHQYYKGYKQYGNVVVSTPEKTIFDCFLKAGLLDYTIITKALYDVQAFDWQQFLSYYREVPQHALHQRTGYILDCMRKKLHFKVPSFVLDYLVSRKGKPVKLYGSSGPSMYNKRWNVQDNVGEKRFLGWWY